MEMVGVGDTETKHRGGVDDYESERGSCSW